MLLLAGFFVSLAVAGYIEVTVPHPAPGECRGCWVEHGFGTAQNLDDYMLIVVPVAGCFVFLGFLAYFFVHERSSSMGGVA